MNGAAITVLWAAKGGSGTTTVAAALAILNPHHTLLVDLDGELPAAAGLPNPRGDGVADWLRSDEPSGALSDLTTTVNETTRLLPCGTLPVDRHSHRWAEFAEWAATQTPVVIDAGTGTPPRELQRADTRSLLVTRACYLSMRRAVASPTRPDGIILVTEPGRSLRATDVARVVGVPVVATVDHDPAIARAIDAGLLAARIPAALRRNLDVQFQQPTTPPAPSAPTPMQRRSRQSGRGIA